MRTLTKLLWILLLGVVFSCQDNVIDAIDATIDEKNFDTKMYETSVSVEDARKVVNDAVVECVEKNISDWGKIKMVVKETLSDYLWKKIKRNPMILPIIMEVE